MSEFHDPELRQELGRLSGPYPDDNAAFAAWQRRVGQVRRRRAVAWTTGGSTVADRGRGRRRGVQGPGRHTLVPGKDAAESTVQAPSTVATTHAKSSTTESTTASTTASSTTEAPDTTVGSGIAPDTSVPDEHLGTDPEATTTATTHKGSGSKGTSTSAAPTSATPTTDGHHSHGSKTTVLIRRRIRHGRSSTRAISASTTSTQPTTSTGTRPMTPIIASSSRSRRRATAPTITVWLEDGNVKSYVDEKTETHGDSYGGGNVRLAAMVATAAVAAVAVAAVAVATAAEPHQARPVGRLIC